MKDNKMTLNPIVSFLGKEPKEFTKVDIIKFIEENDIQMVNFRYVAGDGKMKTLNFALTDKHYLEQILSSGERIDGSNIFPDFIEAGSSDLYIVPRFRTAFVDPFAEIPTVCFLCSFFDKDGNPLEKSPEYVLQKADKKFTELTGLEFWAMGELEYYVIGEKEDTFEIPDQRGYHESMPFAKFEQFRTQCMYLIAQCGGQIKYGHSEVGNFTLDDKIYEQNEIEFLPCPVRDAADQLVIAKWIINTLAHDLGLDVTFAPKITEGKAGSGMHIHTMICKNGKNAYVAEDGKLNDNARRAIAGFLTCATSLTAFGNTNPTSYFRLVPHQEAPTSICWGDRNRAVLVRVPLGWTHKGDMVALANPLEEPSKESFASKQTVEFRCSDGSADIYLLLAGLTCAARHGFEMQDALDFAAKRYVDFNVKVKNTKIEDFDQLPASCFDSAECLEANREIFEKYDIFNGGIIDAIVKRLKSFQDQDIREQIKQQPSMLLDLVKKYFY